MYNLCPCTLCLSTTRTHFTLQRSRWSAFSPCFPPHDCRVQFNQDSCNGLGLGWVVTEVCSDPAHSTIEQHYPPQHFSMPSALRPMACDDAAACMSPHHSVQILRDTYKHGNPAVSIMPLTMPATSAPPGLKPACVRVHLYVGGWYLTRIRNS